MHPEYIEALHADAEEALGELDALADAAELLEAIDQARLGDPFPLIGLQWGRVIRADEVLDDPGLPARVKAAEGRYLILDDFQYDAIQSVFDPTIREIYVKGNTGCGKGAISGIIVSVYYTIWPDAQVIVTRDSFQTAVSVMFNEVRKWFARMRFPPANAHLQTAAIIDMADRQHCVRVASPDSGEGFSGVHSPHVLMLFDEATAPVLEERFDLADTQASTFLAIANPRTTSGKFRDAFYSVTDEPNETQTVLGPTGLRRLITVDGAQCLNVRAKCLKVPVAPRGGITIDGVSYSPGEALEPEVAQKAVAVIPGQTCYDEFLGLKSKSDPRWVACFAHGRFPEEDPERQLIFGRWLRGPVMAHRRWHTAWERAQGRGWAVRELNRIWPVEAFGLDVGGSKLGDPSVLTCGGHRGIRGQFEGQYDDAAEMCDWVNGTILDQYGIDLYDGGLPICIDVDGIGWAVAGFMARAGAFVIEHRGNVTSEVDARRYANFRAEGWGEFAKRLDPKGDWSYDQPPADLTEKERMRFLQREGRNVFALPDSVELFQELRAVEKVFASDGFRFHVTPKRRHSGLKKTVVTIQDKIGRSPDRGDSLIYFYRALVAAGMSLDDAVDRGFF